ncbi:Gmad2 immunoglobulin-like domain-containing protein [Nocardioides baculatus]|uniref:Bacterial spore germination immunoglobulin-like domain-containing protein n=1 Tax=Nocardioides baculatus TaxID=2801337 RepID=A0ABS1L8T9_9ACTN|nr:Gmad2 immunoglobulin-like domain-containing protein [Nocardioides baculatus]MBL0748040.1 hypothetical protein [Nocardioides baculatus]
MGSALLVLTALLGGCGGDPPAPATAPRAATSGGPTSAVPPTTPTAASDMPAARPSSGLPRGLVFFGGGRARTGEWQLFAEPTDLRGRDDLLAAVRTVMAGAPDDPDRSTLWNGDVVEQVALRWDGDEGYYDVRLVDAAATRRPPGTSMREAHLAIQQVVWTLGSVGRVEAPVRFTAGRSPEPVTDLLGIPATGPDDTYPAADRSGVLSSMHVLTPAEGTVVSGVVDVSGLAESFEATVGIRVVDASGKTVLDDATSTEQCCGRLWPWRYELDTSGWAPGTYVVEARTDDPVGIAQGSDGPEIDTRTIRVD